MSNGGGMGSSIGGLGSGSRRGKRHHKDEDFELSDNDDDSELFDPYNNKKD